MLNSVRREPADHAESRRKRRIDQEFMRGFDFLCQTNPSLPRKFALKEFEKTVQIGPFSGDNIIRMKHAVRLSKLVDFGQDLIEPCFALIEEALLEIAAVNLVVPVAIAFD